MDAKYEDKPIISVTAYPCEHARCASWAMIFGTRGGGGASPWLSRPSGPRLARTTLVKVENGDPGVSIGIYATVLFVMGMVERLADLADPKNDSVGLQLEEENLPQRIRGAGKQKRTKGK